MKHWILGWSLAILFLASTGAQAQSVPTGSFGGESAPQPPRGGGGAGMVGVGGGFSGCFGGCPCSFGGCFGNPCNIGGCCGFGGCFGGLPCQFGGGCFGGFQCQFGGCFGSQPTQTYSQWSHSPGRSYFYRTLHIKTPAPNESTIEFIMVHQPDRPKHYYFFDPVDKKYFGRYMLGAKTEQCFALLSVSDRKINLKDIPDSAYRTIAAMPTMPQIIRPRPGTTVDPSLQNVKLMRPPEVIPDQLLGLPPEEAPKK